MSNNESMPKQIFEALTALNNAIVQRDDKVNRIEHDFPDKRLKTEEYNNRKKRLAVVNQSFDQEWILLLSNLDGLCKRVRQGQPHLNKLSVANINTGTHFPDELAFGRMHLSYENWKGYVPRVIPFPFRQSLWMPNKETNLQLIYQLLLRLLHCMPIGTFEIIAVDPLKLGTSLDPFLSLINVKQLFPDQRLLTRSDELEKVLSHLTNYVEDLLQNKFKGKIKNWSTYNVANKDNPLPYKLLLIFGVPEQLTDKSIWYLSRLLEHGPSCGVLPVLTVNEESLNDRKYTNLLSAINDNSKKMDSFIPAKLLAKHITKINITEEQEFWPKDSELTGFLELVSEKYELVSEFSKNLTDLWDETEYWGYDSIQGINVPIGWTADGETVPFSIGGVNTEHHVLLAGRSGSGKSNLLHVLIHSICHSYSPSELNIYLLDYKQGTEFNAYASPPLPQAKLVATESDPEYGITVLAHLTEELEKRALEFKNSSVRDYYEYREKSLTELPRILLIIDEFQILFSEGRQVAEPAEKMLNTLLRQGRAFGIHVLLATQTLKGIQSLSMGQLISQIGCRIALTCSEEDSAMILGNNNWEASQLNSPPEGIINNSNGAKSANQRFFIPFADNNICKIHNDALSKVAFQRGYSSSTKIFNGSHPPKIPKLEWFKNNNSEGIHLHLGVQLTFEANPLAVTIINRHSSNLLISGYNNAIHDGLLLSTLQSLILSDDVDEIVYINGRTIESIGASKFLNGINGKTVHKYDGTKDLDLLSIHHEINKTKRVLVIDGLDSMKDLCSGSTGFRPVKRDEPPSSQDMFKKILDEGPPNGTFVIAYVDNWKRCNTACKDLLNLFELRVGFCMNEDDAGTFISGSIGKFKGLEKDNRAVFTDCLKNQVAWFRPYSCGEST